MSIRSRIPLDGNASKIAELHQDSHLRVDLEADLVYCDDRTFEFIVDLYRRLRTFVKEQAALRSGDIE